jgi:hypothetical protein
MIVVFFLQEWADLGDSLIAHLLDMSIFLFFFIFLCLFYFVSHAYSDYLKENVHCWMQITGFVWRHRKGKFLTQRGFPVFPACPSRVLASLCLDKSRARAIHY